MAVLGVNTFVHIEDHGTHPVLNLIKRSISGDVSVLGSVFLMSLVNDQLDN